MILRNYVANELAKVKTPFEWQMHLSLRRSRFSVLPSDDFFIIEDTWNGRRAILSSVSKRSDSDSEGGCYDAESESEDSAIALQEESSGAHTPTNAETSSAILCATATSGKGPMRKKGKQPVNEDTLWENMEHNGGYPRDKRVMPLPIIVTVYIDGKPCRALIDTGAFADNSSPDGGPRVKVQDQYGSRC